MSIRISGLAEPPGGQQFTAWLAGVGGDLALGTLQMTPSAATLTYISPTSANLLRSYDQVVITSSPGGEVAPDPATVVFQGALPADMLAEIQMLLATAEGTPGSIGIALGLRQESDELLRHAQLLREAHAAGDLPLVKQHAEQLLNLVHGTAARDYNGDGRVLNPGDGVGLLPNGNQDGYITRLVDAARRIAALPSLTPDARLHAENMQIAGENTRQRVIEIDERASRITQANQLVAIEPEVPALVSLAEQLITGVDANSNAQIEPIVGEAGVLAAYQQAQALATLPLVPTPLAQPTAAQLGEVVVLMKDFVFEPQEVRVKAGTTIVWSNVGVKPHSATAVDTAFNTSLFAFGETRSVTLTTPGTFFYYCETHSTPDATEGMIGSIIVEP
ncbi:MAG: cupredoxin domain-containing protein [Roseiflexaceae bacterium]|nr:cupredoxin domain-containing protein [Roseiflexaceae bacterium]